VREWVAARRELLLWIVGTRLVVLVAAFVVSKRNAPRGYFPSYGFDSLNTVLGGWDGKWYRIVAEHGYTFTPGERSDTAFFPLFPLLLRVVHVLGPDLQLAGLILAHVFFVVAVLAFAELTTELFDAETGRRAAIWLCVIPMGFVFSMAYPTSMVFALMALSALAALRGRWLWAALAVGLAGLGRPEAVAMALPLAAIAWQRRDEITRWRAVTALLAAPLAVLGFWVYLWIHLGNAHAWSASQREWGREFRWTGIVDAIRVLPGRDDTHPWIWRDVAFVAVYLVLLLLARRVGVGWPWIGAAAFLVLFPLTSGTFESDARFGMLGFAFYWVAARLVRGRWLEPAVYCTCLVVMAWWVLVLPLANP
jgi:hypothetical protein